MKFQNLGICHNIRNGSRLANSAKTFNKNLPRVETVQGFKINRTHVWFSFQLFYVNPGVSLQLQRDKLDIIHTIGLEASNYP